MSSVLTIEQELSAWTTATFDNVAAGTDLSGVDVTVTPTADARHGDYQCNAAMALAKLLKKSPRDIASAFVEQAELPDCVDRVEIAGPGFINLFLKNAWLAKRLEALQEDPRLGVPETGRGQTIVIDYSGPNVAKPMHIGHIRSTVIGNALDRMHRFLGYTVYADNHLGDWGTQFGIIIVGFREMLDEKAFAESPVEELERLYVESYNRTKTDEQWLDHARAELVKLQQGDKENLALWQQFIDLSVAGFQKIYERLDVTFDHVRGESYYRDKLAAVVDQLKEKGIAETSDGALVVHMEGEDAAPCIIQKSDGGFNYATTDIATILTRVEEFKPDVIVYVTDERQQLHFSQVFTVARKMGVEAKLDHIWFGLMRLPEATFSTREGNVIKLESLLDEAEARALKMVEASSPDMDPAKQKDVATAVGIGAIKYMDLSQNPQSLVTFTWEKALSLEGNSAPYLQYAHARIASVRDKYADRFDGAKLGEHAIQIGEEVERKLALQLIRYADTVLRATERYKPNTIADYLYELSQLYSSFYQNVPFLKADEGVRESRVRISDIVAKTLRNGLKLLGIDTPDRI